MVLVTTKWKMPTATESQRRRCGTCFWWKFKGVLQNMRYGDCAGAIERARVKVPFAINLSVSATAEHGGKNCPCYRRQKKA